MRTEDEIRNDERRQIVGYLRRLAGAARGRNLPPADRDVIIEIVANDIEARLDVIPIP